MRMSWGGTGVSLAAGIGLSLIRYARSVLAGQSRTTAAGESTDRRIPAGH